METTKKISVGVGDIKIAKAPAVITTYLGSCVAVCLYAPVYKVGGLIHLMLPKAIPNKEGVILKKAKYADVGIPELLHQLKTVFKLENQDFTAKIFGGASILKTIHGRIGQENLDMTQNILRGLKIRILASNVGGEHGYKIEFNLSTGKVACRVFSEILKEF